MSFGQKLKKLRTDRGLTLQQLSDNLFEHYPNNGKNSFTKGKLSNWENDKAEPLAKTVSQIAEYYGVTMDYLIGISSNENYNVSDEIAVKMVPVVSKISAGFPIYSEQNIIEHAPIPAYLEKNGKEYFYLKVSGDSMDKEFKEGDLVLIERDCPIESGQIGVVIINGYNATVKRVRYNENQIILYPESTNPEHLPQIYTNDDTVKCVGKVISVQKFY